MVEYGRNIELEDDIGKYAEQTGPVLIEQEEAEHISKHYQGAIIAGKEGDLILDPENDQAAYLSVVGKHGDDYLVNVEQIGSVEEIAEEYGTLEEDDSQETEEDWGVVDSALEREPDTTIQDELGRTAT